MYEIRITETGRNTLKDRPCIFNSFIESCKSKQEMEDFFVDRYGKKPQGKNKVCIDTKTGSKEIGFVHSFWNKDWSHDSKSWFQTDWIEIYEYNTYI